MPKGLFRALHSRNPAEYSDRVFISHFSLIIQPPADGYALESIIHKNSEKNGTKQDFSSLVPLHF